MTDDYAIANTMHDLAKPSDNKNEQGTMAAAKHFIETHNLAAQSDEQLHGAEDCKSLAAIEEKTVSVKRKARRLRIVWKGDGM